MPTFNVPASFVLKNRYLNESEASIYLGFERQTLAVWRMKKRGPKYLKAGKSVRYKLSELDQWAAARTVETVTVA